MKPLIAIFAVLLLIVSTAANLLIRITLKPKYDEDLDDYYHEFEDAHPGLAKYHKWSKITFSGIALAILMIFLVTFL
jgi:hypothetical protein